MITAPIFWLIKIAAALGGAIIGYLISGPAIRLLYRLAFQRPAPGWMVPLGKLGGAALLGALFFFMVSLGGSGWGWGGGGGGSGDGVGPGTGPTSGDKPKPGMGTNEKATREKLVIELLGGNRVGADGRYYLLNGREPAKTLGEVEDVIKQKPDKIIANLQFTDESVALRHPAVERLRDMLQRHQVPIVMPPEN